MLPLVWWQEPEERSIYESDSLWSSLATNIRQRIVFKTAVLTYSTAWPQSTSRCTASQRQLSPADVSGLLTPVDCLLPAPGRATATAVSPSRDRVRGTVFLLNSEHQTLGWKCSDANWTFLFKCSCDCSAIAAFSDLALYKFFNNNNSNNYLSIQFGSQATSDFAFLPAQWSMLVMVHCDGIIVNLLHVSFLLFVQRV